MDRDGLLATQRLIAVINARLAASCYTNLSSNGMHAFVMLGIARLPQPWEVVNAITGILPFFTRYTSSA